ncbi:LacI family transcriptional regulator [Flavobacteriaceae bacterium MAR_2010_72]|nr:LacI family transcriptional regulator [Flavobacteriaceae bacterium MAR_2010_72]TVZ58670.1 LacI family transcriptional regulator [Flavobacteriaceae bacterium MAR_2010_105]
MSKVTLKKIAETLGISTATVSKALKDYADVSPTTKSKVKALAEKLNFKPNSYAQSLRTQESKIIGLIIPQIVHHFFANIILGVIKSAEKEGYLVITLQSDESYDIEKEQLELLLDKNVDGILLSLADNTVRYKHISEIINDGIPIVLYDKISKSIECNKVVIDDKKAAYNATKHLIDSGCKRIAHIRGRLKPQTTIDRFKGYKEALKAHNIPFDKSIVFEAKNIASFEDGKNVADEIFLNHKDVDGIFAMTDLLATGVLVRLKELNVKIPKDISIMGFSNWFLTRITTPKLSTVDQPGYKMGEEAFKILFEQINNTRKGIKAPYKTIEIPTEVIIRDSTK